MARKRDIHPGFFTNEILGGDLPVEVHLFFAGLWCQADREGRLEDRPKKLKLAILPYREFAASDALKELESTGFILRYEAKGVRYIQILNWEKYQRKIHPNETESVIPPYVINMEHQRLSNGGPKEVASNACISVPSLSSLPSCPPKSPKGEFGADESFDPSASERNDEPPDSPTPKRRAAKAPRTSRRTAGHSKFPPEVVSRFESFWASYPAREGSKGDKKLSLQKFAELPETEQHLAIRAAVNYADHCAIADRRTRDAQRFLVSGRGVERTEFWREFIDWKRPDDDVDSLIERRRMEAAIAEKK